MSDLISRQAAIDMLKNRWKKTRNYEGIGDDIAEECELYLKQVPSAQPEHVTDISKKVEGDCISRQAAIDVLCDEYCDGWQDCKRYPKCKNLEAIQNLPSAQSEIKTDGDTISRQQTIDALMQEFKRIPTNSIRAKLVVENLPSAQPETNCSETPNTSDTISRQDAVSRRRLLSDLKELITAWEKYPVMAEQIKGVEVAIGYVELIPSAQPERTCVNCGRTANNGGWYADGGTRCPIEEHYALPKDGFCHLWEKRNVTDDDYPERRTDGKST